MKKVVALLTLVFVAAALVACGSDSESNPTTTETANKATSGATAGSGESSGGGGGGGSGVKLEADPNGALAYTTTEVSAKAGNVTIDFNNPQALEHDVAVESSSGEEVGKTDLIANESTSVTLQDLKPGTYTFFCSVPGHREAGMEGTLTVK
jgi:plastocyanin